MKLNKFIFWIIWICISGGLFAEEIQTPPDMNIIRQKIAIKDSLQILSAQEINDAEVLAQRIKLYRSKEELNTREHRRLTSLLREAQIRQLAMQQLENQQDSISSQINILIDQGLDWIHNKLNETTNSKNKTSLSTRQMTNIESWLLMKSELESYQSLYKPVADGQISVKINAEDSPEILEVKGDILLDREDRFQEEMEMIDKRIASLQVEADVRRKVRDMSNELSLFNEDEELLTRTVPVYSSEYPYNNMNYWDESRINQPIDSDVLLTDAAPGIYSPISETSQNDANLQYLRTPEMIDNAIERLRSHKNRLEIMSDSLKIKADEFYHEAGKRKGQLK